MARAQAFEDTPENQRELERSQKAAIIGMRMLHGIDKLIEIGAPVGFVNLPLKFASMSNDGISEGDATAMIIGDAEIRDRILAFLQTLE